MLSVVKKLPDHSPIDELPEAEASSTCVIVSSGGILLRHPNLGAKIDSYDYVIRFSLPRTKDFESYVGNKSSMNFGFWSSYKAASETGRELNNTHFIYGGNKSNNVFQTFCRGTIFGFAGDRV